MDQQALETLLKTPDVQRRLVGNFQGAYAVGISEPPTETHPPRLLLRVASQDVSQFPTEINLAGEQVAIDVRPNFRPPMPQGNAVRPG
jgi:hypothetical protein